MRVNRLFFVLAEHFSPSSLLHYKLEEQVGTITEQLTGDGYIHYRQKLNLWGETQSETLHHQRASNDEILCNFRFVGQYADEESGLYYNRFRYYSPETGQYVSSDPIGLLGGFNPYEYVFDPTGWIDPLGLSENEGMSFKAAFRAAKRQLGIPKNVNIPSPVKVYDSQYENRTVWAFKGEHDGKFIVMHADDKFGRGIHLHTASIKDEQGNLHSSPLEKGRYNQHKGHIPEETIGIKENTVPKNIKL